MKTTIFSENYREIKFSSFEFPGGEIQVRLETELSDYSFNKDKNVFWINTHLTNSNKVMEMLLLTDALQRKGIKRIALYIPYLPYARQDRVCYPGEALSLKVMCDMINSQNYEKVVVNDVHSDVAKALLNNAEFTDIKQLVWGLIPVKNTILVAPDVGSRKKVADLAKDTKSDLIYADKIRNPQTGEITDTTIHWGDVKHNNRDFLIVDDICDGGRTFIELASRLRPTALADKYKVNLYVTHGIFSKGFDVFKGLIDNIYVYHSFVEDVPDFVHIIGV